MYVRSPDFVVRFSATGNGKSHWKIVGYPKGRRETHWFKDERAAKNEAERLNFAVRKYGPEAAGLSIHQRLDAYRAIVVLEGLASLTEAASYYMDHKRLRMNSKPLASIIEECIALSAKRMEKGDLSKSQYDNLKKGSVRLLAAFGTKDADDITRQDILRWLDSMDVSATSKDYFRRYANLYFNFSLERGYVRSNPLKGIPSSGRDGEIAILSVDQCRRLMHAATEHMVPYYAIGLFAGLRPESEIKRLDWSAFDFEEKILTVRNWKTEHTRTARYRHVDMSKNLLAWLAPYRDWQGSVWPDSWRTSHDATRKAAGIAHWPHDAMRRSYASYLMALRQDAGFVADQLGHTDATMIYNNYRRLVRPREAVEFWNIYPQQALPDSPNA